MKRFFRKVLAVLLFIVVLNISTACRESSSTSQDLDTLELRVFAASSLTDVFTEISKHYEEEHAGTEIILNFASSSRLASQLRERVEADVYASANMYQMQYLIDIGLIDAPNVITFVENKLTIIVPAGNPANIQKVEDIGKVGVKLILAVEDVPVREYADQVIGSLPEVTQKSIYENLVSEESNVRQVVTKIALGEADAGIVYQSDVTPDIKKLVEIIEIPDSMNVKARYPIGILNESEHQAEAEDFIQFVLSEYGQMLLTDWGFDPVNVIFSEAAE